MFCERARAPPSQVKTVKAAQVLPGQAMPVDGVPDMVVLENLHEASILECVDRRFRKNLIYVRCISPRSRGYFHSFPELKDSIVTRTRIKRMLHC